MTTLITFLSSKLGRYLALISAILTGVALYGYRKKKEGQASVRYEVQKELEATREAFSEIDSAVYGNSPFERLRRKRNRKD